MERSKLQQLLIDYSEGKIGAADLETLLNYVAAYHGNSELDVLLTELLEKTTPTVDLPVDTETLYRRIIESPKFSRKRRWTAKRYWWYGAASVLLLAGGWLAKMHTRGEGDRQAVTTQAIVRTVTSSPSDKPILRLADGRVINLDDVADGLLAIEGGTQIKFDGATLYYQGEAADSEGKMTTNTIITPKGRQYQLVLPDGSRIWLNAATELVYPVRFRADKREVTIKGEAYFEVKKAADWPFIVKTESQEIAVLGTHFNVAAYDDDDQAKTTLVEGSIRVSAVAQEDGHSAVGQPSILRPGEQAVTIRGRNSVTVNTVDTEEVISWKNNLFAFNNEEISEVMKEVSRWYDVEVEYLDGMAGRRIGGSIPKFKNINDLMDALEATGLLRYKLEGGVVIIMK